MQDRDADIELREDMQVVTKRRPTEQEWGELLFAWKACKHVRSNAIVIAKNLATAGIGAGQMSRVDSVRIAVDKARTPLDGAALASDAFFPFADGPQIAIEAGVKSIIQPGGSKRDQEVIDACDEAGVAMVFTTPPPLPALGLVWPARAERRARRHAALDLDVAVRADQDALARLGQVLRERLAAARIDVELLDARVDVVELERGSEAVVAADDAAPTGRSDHGPRGPSGAVG